MPQLVWFVTGCSTGFGAEFAKAILSKGDYVIATARNVQNLDGLKAMGAATMQLDVNEPFPNIKEKMQEALTNTLSEHLQTNTVATVNLIAALMPHWREQKRGYIVANSSFSAWWEIVPAAGSYSASKGALDRKSNSYS
ncbi:hypothetical protein D0868_03014 [Hortaea werneckii]|uniref:Uncharacterized protein n=1 Tax=Hortaea werneckii TaxID=91943 RepID=A0A3M6Z986_HORWE|nr:hypothetical protein D0868_03014 [Hortaea werneckii]